MSGTFTQPSSPTSGLQNYQVERGPPKQLYATLSSLFAARRKKKRHRHGDQRTPAMPHLQKGEAMNVYDDMVATLRGAATDAVAAGGDVAFAVGRSIDEFGVELGRALNRSGDLAKLAPQVEDPLAKAMPTISRLASLLSHVTHQGGLIADGKTWESQDDKDAKDPCSDDVHGLLMAAIKLMELALQVAVNEHVSIADEDDLQDQALGKCVVIQVPDADDPENREADILMKVAPSIAGDEDLYRFATDPLAIDRDLADLGEALLESAGAAGLAKAAPVDPNDPDDTTNAGDPEPDDTDPNAAPVDPGDGNVDPLTMIGRLGAAIVLLVDHIQGVDPGAPAPNDGAGAPAADPMDNQPVGGDDGKPPAGKPPGLNKAAPSGSLAKLAPDTGEQQRIQRLEEQLGEVTGALNKLLRQPAPVAAGNNLMPLLAKGADSGVPGAEDQARVRTIEASAAQLAKIADPEKQRQAIAEIGIKEALRHPQPV